MDFRYIVGDKYPNVRYIQLLLAPHDHFPASPSVDSSFPSIAPSASVGDGVDRLSAIPEERDSDLASFVLDSTLFTVFGDVQEDAKDPLKILLGTILEDDTIPMLDKKTLEHDKFLKHYRNVSLQDTDAEGKPRLRLLIDEQVAKEYFSMTLGDNEQAVLHIFAATVKTTVIQRDTDILTKDEERTHWKELQAAMLEET